MIKFSVIFLLALIYFPQSTKADKQMMGKEFELKYGESVQIRDADISVKFQDVKEDSRCPKGATCIWEGNARIVLRVSDQDTTLNTALEPKAFKCGEYSIKLLSVSPYPVKGIAIKLEDYAVQLIVTK